MSRKVFIPIRKVADLAKGKSIETTTRTIFDSDIAAFCGLVGDANPIHLSEVEAKEAGLADIIAPATLVASMGIGLFAATRWLHAVLVVFVGMNDWRAEKPVFRGDSIFARTTIDDVHLTSDGERSVLSLLFEIFAYRDGQSIRVMRYTARFLVKDQEPEAT